MGKSTEDLKQGIEHTREDLGETLDAIGERVSPARIVQRRKDRVRARLTSVRETVMGRTETVQSGTQRMADQASSAAGTVAEQARQAPEQIMQQAQGNPLAAGAIAFGAGVLVASIIPPTKPEQQAAGMVQDKLEPLKERAVAAGDEIKSDIQEAAREAAGQVKDKAAEAAHEVKGQAETSAEHVKGQTQSAVEDVKDRADEQAPRPGG